MYVDFKLYKRSAKATREHFHALGAAGWKYDDIKRLLSACTTMQTTSELLSSVEMSERETARVERRSEAAAKRADEICAKYSARCIFSGDPRGCPVLMTQPGTIGADLPPYGLPKTAWAGGYAID